MRQSGRAPSQSGFWARTVSNMRFSAPRSPHETDHAQIDGTTDSGIGVQVGGERRARCRASVAPELPIGRRRPQRAGSRTSFLGVRYRRGAGDPGRGPWSYPAAYSDTRPAGVPCSESVAWQRPSRAICTLLPVDIEFRIERAPCCATRSRRWRSRQPTASRRPQPRFATGDGPHRGTSVLLPERVANGPVDHRELARRSCPVGVLSRSENPSMTTRSPRTNDDHDRHHQKVHAVLPSDETGPTR